MDRNCCKAKKRNIKLLDNPERFNQYAEKLIKLTAARIKVILVQPESYPMTIYPETRISAMGHFSILYKLVEDKLIITSFWDNR